MAFRRGRQVVQPLGRAGIPERLADEYNRQHQETLDLLAGLSAEELQRVGVYRDMGSNLTGGRHTGADMFIYAASHVDEHRDDLLLAVRQGEGKMGPQGKKG